MQESRSITAVVIGVVSLTLIGAAWFFLIRKPDSAGSRKTPSRRADPYSSYYRDMGQIADSLSTPKPAPPKTPPVSGGANAPVSVTPPGQPLPGQAAPGLTPAAQPGTLPSAAPASPGR